MVCRVVIVDDNPVCLRSIADVASWEIGMGGTIEAYSDPNEFIEASAAGRTPDLLLVDFAMPSMDGVTALRILREKYGVRSRAVIISGFPMEVSHKLLPSNNVSVVVAKPYLVETLRQAIRQALDEVCEFKEKAS